MVEVTFKANWRSRQHGLVGRGHSGNQSEVRAEIWPALWLREGRSRPSIFPTTPPLRHCRRNQIPRDSGRGRWCNAVTPPRHYSNPSYPRLSLLIILVSSFSLQSVLSPVPCSPLISSQKQHACFGSCSWSLFSRPFPMSLLFPVPFPSKENA